MRTISFLLLIIVIGFTSCDKKSTEEPEKKEPVNININRTTKSLVASSSNFGIDLVNKVAEIETAKDNFMISPLSVTIALAMTYNGADGETKKAMEKTLKFKGIDIKEVNANLKDLINKLLNVDKKIDISIANSIWYRNNFNVLPEFINTNKEFYHAEVETLDFSSTAAKDIINKWVADNTKNKIESIIDEISPDAVMYLINAIYFKGMWKYRFDPKNNYKADFHCQDGSVKKVEMMKCKADFKRFTDKDVTVLEMPYGQGNWVIDLLMPNDNQSIDELMKNLTADQWNLWINSLSKSTETDVHLPPFKFEYKIELKKCLSVLGMGIAFSDLADFSKINGEGGISISKVKHKTFIELNEKGTEAAAVTSVEMVFTSVGPNANILRFDKPFMFVIREVSTNTIAFIGKVGQPEREIK